MPNIHFIGASTYDKCANQQINATHISTSLVQTSLTYTYTYTCSTIATAYETRSSLTISQLHQPHDSLKPYINQPPPPLISPYSPAPHPTIHQRQLHSPPFPPPSPLPHAHPHPPHLTPHPLTMTSEKACTSPDPPKQPSPTSSPPSSPTSPFSTLSTATRFALGILLCTLPLLFLLHHASSVGEYLSFSGYADTLDDRPSLAPLSSITVALHPQRHGLLNATSMLRLPPPPPDAEYERYRGDAKPLEAFCLLYDRPPRTGSTTIGSSLFRCFKSRFAQPASADLQNSNLLVRNLLRLRSRKLMLVSKHLHLSRDDVLNLRRECRYLLYISSCRAMSGAVVVRCEVQAAHGEY